MLSLTLTKMANAFMGGHLLADSTSTPVQNQSWFVNLINGIRRWVTPLLILATAAGAIWAIVLGVKMAQADDKSKRDEAKQNLINVIIALVAVIALILIFTIVGDALTKDGLDISEYSASGASSSQS